MPRSSDSGKFRSSRERRGTPVLGEEHPYTMHTLSPPSTSLYVMEQPYHGAPDTGDTDPNMSRPMQNQQQQPFNGGPMGGFRRTMRYTASENGSSTANNNYYAASNSSMNNADPLTSTSAQQPLITTPRATQNNIIRVINKDMTSQFRGRAQSVSNARIRWFENRKSQLLGCCLTMAFLGISIALYDYRWTGLIAGSVNTIICGSAVVMTYCRKKRWHQHPNPIVHIRSVLSMFLAVCLLLNVLVNFDPKSNDNTNCRGLAGITEFFFFTSEAWGLVMACDLFFSLTSPFTSYKRLMRFYHLWVWLGGIVMGAITYGVSGAGGFFTVDGQSVKYNSEIDSVVGFCLASSRICCETGQTCAEGVQMCNTNSSFLNAQQWPWILIYSFVILVVFVSVCVLTLAWHRLYLRGVPKTYNIRLRVLNYISFFTGAYVFYWLLLLLLYMCAYFVGTKSDTSDSKAVAQVLRQLVAFLISSKGYLDYVIWFAVNSIERRSTNGRHRDQDESADLDVDLSPQVNTALRSEILYYTTSGIKESVRAVADELITIPISGEGEKGKSIKFWSFCPSAFRNVRLTSGISDSEYIQMFGATTKERFSEGRSGAFMFFTADERLICKTMSPEECTFLRKIGPNYEAYMTSNYNTLLTRFYGCHAVDLYGKMYYFVVMGNLFADSQVIHHRYDIKGSWIDRNAKVPRPGDKTTCRYCNAAYTFGSTRNQECGDGLNFHEPNIVLKDNDLMTKIRIDPNQAHKIYDQIHKDSDFLCEQGIMDYSLLMGVQSSEYLVDTSDLLPPRPTMGKQDESLFTQVATSVSGPSLYQFGIIDFLQQWTFEKKMERFYKCYIKRKDPDGVSAMPPKPYKFRFQQKMSRIFALSSHMRPNTLQYQRSLPALIDVLDQADFSTQRGGTFPSGDERRTAPFNPDYDVRFAQSDPPTSTKKIPCVCEGAAFSEQHEKEKQVQMVKASSPTVKAIFILDSDGNRVCAKYYDKSYPTAKDQLALEKKLYLKTKNSNPRLEAEIILIDNIVSVYRSGSDVTMHVIGSAHESELILLSVLDATFEAASSLLKGRMDRHVILDNIELVLLTFDEVVDGGIILELDTPSISNRVLMRGIDNEVPIGELTISQVRFHESKVPDVVALVQKFYFVFPLCSIAQAFASAREQFSRSFRS